MKYLHFSLSVMLMGCSSDYKLLQAITLDKACVERMVPQGITTSWYDASVDVVGKHISGLLLIKEMPDESRRVVFTNETGVTFFDFEFTREGVFTPRHIIRQLNKKPVIGTLRKNFYLLLGYPFKNITLEGFKNLQGLYFYAAPAKKETAYFITDKDCASLQRLELGSGRKRKVSIVLSGTAQAPDSVVISHHTFNMVIHLRKLERE